MGVFDAVDGTIHVYRVGLTLLLFHCFDVGWFAFVQSACSADEARAWEAELDSHAGIPPRLAFGTTPVKMEEN